MDNAGTRKSKAFSAKIVQLYKHLAMNKKETVLSEQLLRTGTGIGAILARADCALGKEEFLGMLHTALKSCAETKYWLELLNDTALITEYEFNNTIEDCEDLRNILAAAIKNLRTPR
ncbi:MAG: four helix bundle protein [Spirochaetaceae bacterium]|jgi:four helix bundle protein|nr:four helix bundle protein [Spirochaetaceae bacterium]